MELNTKSDLNFHEGVEKVSLLRLNEPTPSLAQASAAPSESPVPSELHNLFQGYRLQTFLMDALAPASFASGSTTGRGLGSALSAVREGLTQIRPRNPREAASLQEANQAISEDLANHELLDAFRRALLGG